MSGDTGRPDREATEKGPDERVPGETTTGSRPGGRSAEGTPMPGGAVPDVVGRVHGDPGQADVAGDADLGSDDGDHVQDVAERVREADQTLDDPR